MDYGGMEGDMVIYLRSISAVMVIHPPKSLYT